MPRTPRLLVPGATSHVYCRVAGGELAFGDPLEAADFVELFEQFAVCRIEDLASPLTAEDVVHGRIELTLLGVSRYGSSPSDLARIIGKHPSSVSRWHTEGLARERGDHTFHDRRCHFDRQISSSSHRIE